MSERRRSIGQLGEKWAEAFLLQKGYEILGRNIRTRRGEIDLIARDGATLVFVEVRTRTGHSFGTAAESVNWKKQQKLRELALAYMHQSACPIPAFRFDVVAIQCQNNNDLLQQQARIHHIEYAF